MKIKVKKKREVPFYIYAITILLSIVFIYFGHQYASKNMTVFSQSGQYAVEKAKIISIDEIVEEDISSGGGDGFSVKDIFFTAEIRSGALKGEKVNGVQTLNSFMALMPKDISVGDQVLVYGIESDYYGTDWVFGEYQRTDALLVLAGLFFLLLLAFGGMKGFQTIVSLTFTILAIFTVFVPAILSGYNIYFWAILICVYITVMSLVLVSGVNKKTVSAIFGCLGGLLVAGIILFVMDIFLKLTGLVSEESVYLVMLSPDRPIDLKAMFFGAMLIGALGAIMDVAMSIASALSELHASTSERTYGQMIQSGFAIGKDIMGTMANTLILAYIGSSLSVVLLLITYNSNLLELFNREMVVLEVLQSLSGSLGILFTIPMTAIVSSILLTGGHKTHESQPQDDH